MGIPPPKATWTGRDAGRGASVAGAVDVVRVVLEVVTAVVVGVAAVVFVVAVDVEVGAADDCPVGFSDGVGEEITWGVFKGTTASLDPVISVSRRVAGLAW